MSNPGGFSDLPLESPRVVSAPVPDEHVEAIGTLLQTALADEAPEVRESAAACLAIAPRSTPAVEGAIAKALTSSDPVVYWYLRQLDESQFTFPDPKPYVGNLVALLKTGDWTATYAAQSVIERYADEFAPYTGQLVDALPEFREADRPDVLRTLSRVGLSVDVAERLSQCVSRESAETQAAAFVALLPYPNMATQFVREHPDCRPSLIKFVGSWREFLYSTDPALHELRSELIRIPNLGPVERAFIGSPDAVPELERELARASGHRQTLLRACIRACGGATGDVVRLSAETPVVFKPRSAWPGSDPRRDSNEVGHGDGMTQILVTGEMTYSNGGHPAEVHFLRTNDGMLLGESVRAPLPLKYDPASGRFVLTTAVFAAFASGEPSEPGPYQTGSAQVRIESPGCKPLTVQFFDEMPHVVIELRRE